MCSPSSGERFTSVIESDILIGLPTVRYLPRRRMVDLDHGAGLAQRLLLGDLLHRQDRADRNVVLLQMSMTSNLVLVMVHCFDRGEDVL